MIPKFLLRSENINAAAYSKVHLSTMNAEQMVNDSGRGPASKIAEVYSPLLSGHWSLSVEKSRTFIILPQIGTEQYSHLLPGSVV